MNTTLNIGLQGYLNSERKMTRAAQEIADYSIRPITQVENAEQAQAEPRGSDNLVEPLVDLYSASIQAKANLKTVATANETLGAIIDIEV